MGSDLVSRKSHKGLFLFVALSTVLLVYKFWTPTSSYSYYKRATLLGGLPDSEIENTLSMNWTDHHGVSNQIPLTTMLAKAFSYSGDSDIVPYYYKAQKEVESKDITVVTLVTRNRIPNLARLAKKYKGPISTTIHISNDQEGQYTLESLHRTMEKNPEMRRYVDVHIVRDAYDRELNLWRNVAKLFARTDYVMLLDIDFYPCTNIRKNVLNNPKAIELLDSGEAALVIPAFEFTQQQDGLDYRTFPKSKKELVDAYESNRIEMFHSFWLPGHAPTDYERWTTHPHENALYQVTSYQHSYEPYVIFKNQGSSWCDERFAGYGSNKAACLYELYVSGVNYYVLPNDFIVHQTHAYPDEAREVERYYNRRLYTQFREELCIRLARRFIARGQWELAISENLRKECASIKPYQRAIARFV
ncbi:glycosyl-transferase for dystroglycan-domain-containing protein [Sporodiniella umbellata]|nr:glycosyl-transferase for dystroglycan-domain-containing protein [Sporodiniella umbellata]